MRNSTAEAGAIVRRAAAGAVAVAFAAALTCWTPSAAKACGGTPASWTLLTIDGTKVMEGTRVLKLYQYGFTVDLSTTTFTLRAQAQGATAVAIPVTVRATSAPHLFEIDLGALAVERASYALEIVSKAGGDSGFSETLLFEGVAAPAIPRSLGTLHAAERAQGRLNLGGCGAGRDGVQVVLELHSADEAAAWERQADHQLLVDGVAVFEPEMALIDYVTRPKALRVRAMAYCTDLFYGGGDLFVDAIDVALAPGQYEMRWRTHYRDGTELVSNAVQVDLRCGMGPASAPDAGQSSAPDAGVVIPLPDGGRAELVGDVVPSIQPSTAAATGDAAEDAQGCAVRPAGQAAAGVIPACLLLLAARLRRRSARRANAL